MLGQKQGPTCSMRCLQNGRDDPSGHFVCQTENAHKLQKGKHLEGSVMMYLLSFLSLWIE